MDPEVLLNSITKEDEKRHLVPVEITIDNRSRTVEVPSGPTVVSTLKTELGVPEEDALFQIRPIKRPLVDDEVIGVAADQAFEAIHGGGVS